MISHGESFQLSAHLELSIGMIFERKLRDFYLRKCSSTRVSPFSRQYGLKFGNFLSKVVCLFVCIDDIELCTLLQIRSLQKMKKLNKIYINLASKTVNETTFVKQAHHQPHTVKPQIFVQLKEKTTKPRKMWQ